MTRTVQILDNHWYRFLNVWIFLFVFGFVLLCLFLCLRGWRKFLALLAFSFCLQLYIFKFSSKFLFYCIFAFILSIITLAINLIGQESGLPKHLKWKLKKRIYRRETTFYVCVQMYLSGIITATILCLWLPFCFSIGLCWKELLLRCAPFGKNWQSLTSCEQNSFLQAKDIKSFLIVKRGNYRWILY